eukprot:gene5292-biopygen19218
MVYEGPRDTRWKSWTGCCHPPHWRGRSARARVERRREAPRGSTEIPRPLPHGGVGTCCHPAAAARAGEGWVTEALVQVRATPAPLGSQATGAGVARAIGIFWLGVARAWRVHGAGMARACPTYYALLPTVGKMMGFSQHFGILK